MSKMKTALSEALKSEIKPERIQIQLGETVIDAVVRPMSDYVLREWILAEQREFIRHKELLDQDPANRDPFSDHEWSEIVESARVSFEKSGQDFKPIFLARYKDKPATKSDWFAREIAVSEAFKIYIFTMLYDDNGDPLLTEKEEIQLFKQLLDTDYELKNKLTEIAGKFVLQNSEISKKKLKIGNVSN